MDYKAYFTAIEVELNRWYDGVLTDQDLVNRVAGLTDQYIISQTVSQEQIDDRHNHLGNKS